ncbi:unnamed protein product [Rotaria sordida]|uniref:F-box domain-containing protein n=1 Tax=Rotaria sordida TaxID=392033 RepID=A0A815PVV1_9BILA|nr:unnamed protein product [Rotaria sordida]CAF4071015.1 unnamed protein product [Rotaria sordida]
MKRADEDMNNSLLSLVPFHDNRTTLLDLPNEILLLICRYLSPTDVLYSFYTPEKAETRLHRLIIDYYTKIKLDKILFDEYAYIHWLLGDSNNPLQPESLILSNEHITCLTERYFTYIRKNLIQSIFINLKRLTLIDCSTSEIQQIDREYIDDLTQLEYFHINVHKSDKDLSFEESCDGSIGRILFNNKLSSLRTIKIELLSGLSLYQSLISHENLRHIEIILKTIDDLYILLDGLIPNVQLLIIHLTQTRILTCHYSPCKLSCPQLTEFALFEPRVGLVIDNLKCIFSSMSNIIKLTLSIRDTPDSQFCHGPTMESILTEYLPYLRQFDYTMTHRVTDELLIEDFIRWSMNVTYYFNENSKWIHIYSLPWPSNKDDQRRLPIVKNGYMVVVGSGVKRAEHIEHLKITESDELIELETRFDRVCKITTCFSIDRKLPERITKLILTEETPISSITSIVQPYIHHLIVERRLIDEQEISSLAYQYPNVKYLQLLFPLDHSSFRRYFQVLFSMDGSNDKKSRFWSGLINFSTKYVYGQANGIRSDGKFHQWLIENTDLKYHTLIFYANCSNSMFSIWL